MTPFMQNVVVRKTEIEDVYQLMYAVGREESVENCVRLYYGVAGTGKSTLLGEFVRLAQDQQFVAAHIDGVGVLVTRSSNHVGSTVTVSQPSGVGTYEVDFGFNVSQRFYLAVCGQAFPGNTVNTILEVTPRNGKPNAVYVESRDNTGTLLNARFFVLIF